MILWSITKSGSLPGFSLAVITRLVIRYKKVMPIETKCVIRCDSCARFIDGAIRLNIVPAFSNELKSLEFLRLNPTCQVRVIANNLEDWKMDSSGNILCYECRHPSFGPYR